jgi:hypothetical protein
LRQERFTLCNVFISRFETVLPAVEANKSEASLGPEGQQQVQAGEAILFLLDDSKETAWSHAALKSRGSLPDGQAVNWFITREICLYSKQKRLPRF